MISIPKGPEQFRIVKELKGDCAAGFRVQIENVNRKTGEVTWRNKGRRVFLIKDAKKAMEFFIAQANAATVPVAFEVVEFAESANSSYRYP